ncbi:hypothetical protein DAF96_18615 [Clostridioides difficile]|nr:hypothetical protein [Clostridioides difficile]
MGVKSEIGKIIATGAMRTGKHLVKEMVQLPSLNFRYNLVNRADKMMLNGVHKALSMPANLIGEGKNIMYEARKNKGHEDINYNNTTQYNLNEMLKYSQIQSHEPLYKSNSINDIGLAEQFASLEIASNARRNLYNNFKR